MSTRASREVREISGSTSPNIVEVRPTAIETPPTSLAAELDNSRRARPLIARVAAAAELPIDLAAELAIVPAEVALELPLGLLGEREPLGLAVAEQGHDPGLERALGPPVVAAAATASVAAAYRRVRVMVRAAVETRSAAVVVVAGETSLAPAATGAAIAWVEAASAAGAAAAVVAVEAVAVEGAGDERAVDEEKNYENKI
jgi:hypothetical protein